MKLPLGWMVGLAQVYTLEIGRRKQSLWQLYPAADHAV